MKNFLTTALTILLFTACGEQPTTNKAAAENEKIARQLYTHFNNHDWVKMSELFVENAEFRDPSLGTQIVRQSRAQIVKKYTELQQIFPDVRDDVTAVYPSGDQHIIVEFVSRGTAPDGSKFELPICDIFTIEKGMITKNYTYYDNTEEPSADKK